MSSLRAMVSAASLGSRSWCVLSSPVYRSGPALAPWKNHFASVANFSSTDFCASNEKNKRLEQAINKEEDLPENQPISQSDNTKPTPPPPQRQPAESRSDRFDEIFKTSRRIFSPSFARDCQYRIISWQKRLRQVEKEGKAVHLDEILTDSFPEVVEFSLTPLAFPEVRLSLLKILLSQASDDVHLERILLGTARDVLQLPLGIVAEVVRLLSLAPPTDMRLESRRALVTAVVNERWYEVGAKHLVFFMFQIDELYDIKTMTHQLRQKAKEKESGQKAKSVQKTSETEVSAVDNEEFKAECLNSMESRKGEGIETESTEQQATGKGEDKTSSDAFDPIAGINLESRAISLINEFKVKDLARVVSLLSRWNSRNEPLLNACLHRLSLADMSYFTANQLANLLQAMAALNLHHPTLLDNTTRQLMSSLSNSTPSPSQVCAILQSLSTLRWTGAAEGGTDASVNLTESCLSLLKGHQKKLAVKEAATTLTALANLSAAPLNESEKALVKDLAANVLQGKSPWWGQIHSVWCQAILQCLDSAALFKVLDPQFVDQVLLKVKESSNSSSALRSANKLAQINLAARLEVKGYDGPLLTADQLDICSQTYLTSEQKSVKTALANTLRKFVDLSTYVNFNPAIEKGVTADVLMCANREGEVRPLVSKETSGSAENITESTLSLAIQYIPFSGVNSPGERPTGQYQMTARHLSLLGYTPVQIYYSDLKRSLSVLEKINNIKTRIKSAVKGSNPNPALNNSASLSESFQSPLNGNLPTNPQHEQGQTSDPS